MYRVMIGSFHPATRLKTGESHLEPFGKIFVKNMKKMCGRRLDGNKCWAEPHLQLCEWITFELESSRVTKKRQAKKTST